MIEWFPTTWGRLASGLAPRLRSWRAGVPLLLRDDGQAGQGLAEYALILAFIAIVAISALALFGVNLNAVFLDPIADDIGDVLSGISP